MERDQMYILDTSVIIKWFIKETDTDKALMFRDRYESGEFEIGCLDLMLYEIANVLRFNSKITKKEIGEILTTILDLELELIVPTLRLLKEAVSIGKKYNISVYDASYIALANELGWEFITADEKLYKRVKSLPYVKLLKDVSF
jgi:predicted nucleic acid-binding protein